MRRFLVEVVQVLVIVVSFAVFAAGVEAVIGTTGGPSFAEQSSRDAGLGVYAEFRMTRWEREPATWLIDGFNVLNLAVLAGTEREAFWGPAARSRLLELVSGLRGSARVVIVFDGSRPGPGGAVSGAEPEVIFAPSADEWLMRAIRAAEDPSRVALVTADRQLADRARHRGARVVEPATFVARCREDRRHKARSSAS